MSPDQLAEIEAKLAERVEDHVLRSLAVDDFWRQVSVNGEDAAPDPLTQRVEELEKQLKLIEAAVLDLAEKAGVD